MKKTQPTPIEEPAIRAVDPFATDTVLSNATMAEETIPLRVHEEALRQKDISINDLALSNEELYQNNQKLRRDVNYLRAGVINLQQSMDATKGAATLILAGGNTDGN